MTLFSAKLQLIFNIVIIFVADAPINCTVHEVRVDPCKEAEEGKPCRLKRGHHASISFDYTTCKYY